MTFREYIVKMKPFAWTIVSGHPSEWLNGNNSVVINFKRFELIADALKKSYQKDVRVFDVGVYPGTVPQIFKEYVVEGGSYKYTGVGLGFSEDFTQEMRNFKVDLVECDLDPRINQNENRENTFSLNEAQDVCVFTDVIEHFYDPFYPLTEINKNLKLGGHLILTTDNITHYANTLSLLRGKSPNVPLINGNLFYDGDWRPHFREYSKQELEKLLSWAGFTIVHHEYYEAEFGNYKVRDGKLIRIENTGSDLKNVFKRIVRNALKKWIPHLRDNHFLVAQKTTEYREMLNAAPKLTSDKDKWMQQRKERY